MKDKNGEKLETEVCEKCGLKKSGYFYIYSNIKKAWTTSQRICQGCGDKVVFKEIEVIK